MATNNTKITISQLLFPVSLIAFVLFIMLAFQTSQILRERDAMQTTRTSQDKPLEDAQKVQAQLGALAQGTKKLADHGNKSAQAIIDRLKQVGISVEPPPPGSGASQGAPQGGAQQPAPPIPASVTSEPPKED